MTATARRLFGKIVALREGEAATALLMFAYSFLAMTSYNILKPITRSKFITSLGAENLPYVQLIAGLLIGVLMHFYSRVVTRLPRRSVVPLTQAAEAAVLLLFWMLFLRTDADWVSAAFYVLGLILGLLLISQFWMLANDVYDPRQAKRLFGFIGGGASLGGASGAALTSFAVDEVGTDNLLLVSAAVLALCAVLVWIIVRREDVRGEGIAGEEAVGGGQAFQMLRESRHLRVIALMIGFAAVGAVIIEQQLNMAASAMKGEANTDAITGFLAQVTFYTSIIGFVVQVALTSQIHRSLGLAFALLILPVSLGTTAVIILLNGSLWAPAVARVLDTSLRYSIDKTTREVLFLPLPADMKYYAKPFVDVTVDRFAKALGAVMLLVLIKPWGFNLDWQRLSYASLMMTGLWIVMAMRARGEYLRRFRQGIEARAIAPSAVQIDVADAATLETLMEELGDPDETRVLYAIDMLEALDKRNLVTPLLLHHESAAVRARALRALESARQSVAGRWAPAVERMLNDEDATVRAAAVHALAAISTEDASTIMRRHVDDPEPRVAATAAAILANSRHEADWNIADATLRRLTEDPRDVAVDARREAAAALASVRTPLFRQLLVTLIGDPDPGVARQAIRSVQTTGTFEPLFVPALVALLGHRLLKPDAREVLVGFGEDVLDALAYFLEDPDENLWVRRHIPATLALVPTQRSMDILIRALDDTDSFLRYKAVTAVERLRRDHSGLVIPRTSIELLVMKECTRYDDHLKLRYGVVHRDPPASSSLLVRALDEKLERTLDRIYRLLSLIYSWRDITTARRAIASGDRRTRASGLEYLDNVLKGPIRARVMPILEESTLDEQTRRAGILFRSRPHDLDETLAELVHDEDQIVAAAAILFVERRRPGALTADLEFVRTHRAAREWYVFETACWALSARSTTRTAGAIRIDTLPTVELADRIRGIPLFDFVSVDELFRIADASRQVHHDNGRELYAEGTIPDHVQFLLDGSVLSRPHDAADDGSGEGEARIEAPAALAFEEVLQGMPSRVSITAGDRTLCLSLGRSEFLTVLSDNIAVAKGLFRMLLDAPGAQRWRAVYVPARPDLSSPRRAALQPLDKVLLLRQNPLFARATVNQLLGLASVAREVPLVADTVLFEPAEEPAIYHVLDGSIALETGGLSPIVAGAGSTIGVAEVLAGVPIGRRAVVTDAGHALRVTHDELFDVLADHIDLLQSLFSGLLTASVPAPDVRAQDANGMPGAVAV